MEKFLLYSKSPFLIILSCLLFSNYSAFSQIETLSNLPASAKIEKLSRYKTQLKTDDNLVFLFDTLNLPFLDDFAKNRFKRFDETSIGRREDTVRAFFTINGYTGPAIYFFSSDTTYDLTYNNATNKFDSLALPPDTIRFFESDSILDLVTGDTLVWSPYFVVDSLGTSYTDSVASSGSFTNNFDTITFISDDPFYLWINEGTYHNYTFSNTAPTIGLVTFDGTDANGVPYDLSGNLSGAADRLISKPIRLQGKQNVVLSFFYQGTGNGEDPDKSDSLTLKIKTPEMADWLWLWSDTGSTSLRWKRVAIELIDTFLVDGTQFMFENYATLNGSFDHWHIDYVELNENRNPNNDTLLDIAFIQNSKSYLLNYTSMPYEHFKVSPSTFIKNEQLFNCFNLNPEQKLMSSQFEVINSISKNVVFTSSVIGQPVSSPFAPNVAPSDSFQVLHQFDESIFPITTDSVMDYQVIQRVTSTPDANLWNDTLIHIQKFDTYYSYDDGSAERAYKLIDEPGVQVAMRYVSNLTDTLRALLVNFPYVEEENLNRRVRFKVWNDLDSPPLYESTIQNVPYTNLNQFFRFEFDELLVLNGEFYIGWEQLQGFDLWTGFDSNTQAPNSLFYQLDGLWFSSSVVGALMLRPDFGRANTNPIGIEKLQREPSQISVFPNPSSGQFEVMSHQAILSYELVDLSGRTISSSRNQHIISVSDFTGLALLRVQFTDGNYAFTKVQLIQ